MFWLTRQARIGQKVIITCFLVGWVSLSLSLPLLPLYNSRFSLYRKKNHTPPPRGFFSHILTISFSLSSLVSFSPLLSSLPFSSSNALKKKNKDLFHLSHHDASVQKATLNKKKKKKEKDNSTHPSPAVALSPAYVPLPHFSFSLTSHPPFHSWLRLFPSQ